MQQDRRRFLIGGIGAAGVSTMIGSSPVGAAKLRGAGILPAGGGVNIRDFGAKGDGITIDSPAIDRAIDTVSRKGGGIVYVPAGVYACYTIHLKSRVTIYLEQGATILAAPTPVNGMASGGYDAAEPQDPVLEAYQDYGHNHWHNSLLYGDGIHDIAVLGEGLIWGKGLSRGRAADTDYPLSSAPGVGNKAIALKNCHNVLLRDFKVLEGGWFALLATGVDNMTIDNLTIDTVRDGLDIDCCRNVRVSNCTVNSPFDDAICPKSSFALGYARSTENITISDCYVTGYYEIGSVIDGTWKKRVRIKDLSNGRIKCGTESNGGFKNITITNCVFDNCRGLALETADGAILEDITISNITMRGVTNSPLFLRLGSRMRGPAGTPVGTLKRILLQNIASSGAWHQPSIIAGCAGHPVEDVHLSQIYLEQEGGQGTAMAALKPVIKDDEYPDPNRFGDLPASGLFVRQVKNLVMRDIEIVTQAPDARPAFWMQDVDGVDAFALRVPRGSAFALDNVSNFRNFGSLTVPDRQFVKPASASF
jgi:polygalacturonase